MTDLLNYTRKCVYEYMETIPDDIYINILCVSRNNYGKDYTAYIRLSDSVLQITDDSVDLLVSDIINIINGVIPYCDMIEFREV